MSAASSLNLAELVAQFPPATEADWRTLAELGLDGGTLSDLNCETPDGITISPLYQCASPAGGAEGRLPGKPWAIVQRIDDPDADRAISQIQTDIHSGAGTLSLCLAGSPAAGEFGAPDDGAFVRSVVQNLAGTGAGLRIEPHPRSVQFADDIAQAVEQSQKARIRFGIDPLGILAAFGPAGANGAREGEIGQELAAILGALRDKGFTGPLTEADGRVFHDAGANNLQELGAVTANAIALVRMLIKAGMATKSASKAVGFTIAADCDQFATIAKVRALRLLWARCQEVMGIEPMRASIHAETSRRMATGADAHNNLVRTAVAVLAAGIGGADSICALPHTIRVGLADADARRLARNIHHLLIEESHCAEMSDPGKGSGYITALTESLSEAAWSELQQIECDGGLPASLAAGALQKRIIVTRSERLKHLESGDATIVGVTAFSQPDQPPYAVAMPRPTSNPALREGATPPALNSLDVEAELADGGAR